MPASERQTRIPKGEWSIASFDSTKLTAHWSLWLELLLFGVVVRFWLLPQLDPGINSYLAYALTALLLILLVVSLLGRELTQAQVAKHHGVGISSISMSALGGRTRADSIPPHPKAEFQISSGSLLFTCLLASSLFAGSSVAQLLGVRQGILSALYLLVWLNVALALVNLVPTSPLDGGRILGSILWHRTADRSFAQVTAGRVSILFGGFLIVVGLVALLLGQALGIAALLSGLFAALMGRSQVRGATIKLRLETTTLDDLVVNSPELVPDSLTVQHLQAWALPERSDTAFPVTRWDTSPIGYVVPNVGARLSMPERSWTMIDQVMQPRDQVPRAWSDETIGDVLNRTELSTTLLIVAHDPENLLEIGTVTFQQFKHLFVAPDFWGRTRSSTSAG